MWLQEWVLKKHVVKTLRLCGQYMIIILRSIVNVMGGDLYDQLMSVEFDNE